MKAVTVKVISRGSLETICFCSIRALMVPFDLGVTTLLIVGRTTATISVGSLDPAFTSELFSNPCQSQGHDIFMVSACQIIYSLASRIIPDYPACLSVSYSTNSTHECLNFKVPHSMLSKVYIFYVALWVSKTNCYVVCKQNG